MVWSPLGKAASAHNKKQKRQHSGLLADLAQKPCWLNITRPDNTTVFFNGLLSSGVMFFFNGLAMNVTMAFKVLWLIPEHCKLWPHVNPWQTPPSADDAIPESNHFCGQATRSCEEQPRHLHSTRSCTCAWANRIDTVHLQCPSYPSFSIIFEASIHSKQKSGASCVSLSLSPRPRTKAGSSCWNCWRPSLCRVAVVPRPHGHASPWPPWPPSPPWRPWPLPSGPPDWETEQGQNSKHWDSGIYDNL